MKLTMKKCDLCGKKSDIKVALCFNRNIMECIECHVEHLAKDMTMKV